MESFGSKATEGLCQTLIAPMLPHDVYIESHRHATLRTPIGRHRTAAARPAQAGRITPIRKGNETARLSS